MASFYDIASLYTYLFMFLDARDHLIFGLVCKYVRKCSQCRLAWNKHVDVVNFKFVSGMQYIKSIRIYEPNVAAIRTMSSLVQANYAVCCNIEYLKIHFLTGLTHLNLSGCRGTWDVKFQYLTNLVHLNLSGCGGCVYTQFQHLTSLTYLNLSESHITNDGLRLIGGLTNIEYLNISVSGITHVGVRHIANLTKLTTLILNNTYITGEACSTIANFKNLVYLDLRKCVYVSAGDCDRIKTMLPNCVVDYP
jgi:hypothetical protein